LKRPAGDFSWVEELQSALELTVRAEKKIQTTLARIRGERDDIQVQETP